MKDQQITTSNHWTNILINAVITLSIGAILILVPNTIYNTIIIIAGITLFLFGLAFLIYAYQSKTTTIKSKTYWYFQSVLYFAVGLFLFFKPQIVVNLLHYFISIWLIIVGLTQLFFAANRKHIIGNSSFMLINSIIALSLGILILIWPQFPVVFIGYITLLIGTVLLVYSIGQYKHRNDDITFSQDQQDQQE